MPTTRLFKFLLHILLPLVYIVSLSFTLTSVIDSQPVRRIWGGRTSAWLWPPSPDPHSILLPPPSVGALPKTLSEGCVGTVYWGA
ncbi:hypothetical protein SLEP1_g49200 [Rubroshorea leprosula]|uniref:Uncharacterized protein n=1 Tax=Rubroshorea leprosula TaxID=152421 RepID=A0AAV5LX17_9ROSI|nr:hypothetical protein SLEP1_g49200 [Rubroshorea leprosula]